jgi:hypothetical protein
MHTFILQMKKAASILILFISSASFVQVKKTPGSSPERLRIAGEMENSINTELLNKWYPQCVDSVYGGFITTFTFDFKPTGPQDNYRHKPGYCYERPRVIPQRLLFRVFKSWIQILEGSNVGQNLWWIL